MKPRAEAGRIRTPESNSSELIPLTRYWQPRNWPIWIGLGLLRVLVALPLKVQIAIGATLGRLFFTLAPKRARIAEKNIMLCFPELNQQETKQLVEDHAAAMGMSIIETGMALWVGEKRLSRLVKFNGVENLTDAFNSGRGVIVLSGHFTSTEITGRAAANFLPNSAAMYRPLKNPLADQILRRTRLTGLKKIIPKDDVREMLRHLRAGNPIWYASDQAYDRSNHALIDFFGEPAMTNTALNSIARIGNALVVPFLPRRLADGSGYEVDILPALEDFPTSDPVADTERVHRLLEEQIRRAPEQYYWVHRRFKNRPAPYTDPYRTEPN